MSEPSQLTAILTRVLDILKAEGVLSSPQEFPVIQFRDPHKLRDVVLDLNLGAEGCHEEKVFDLCQDVIKYSVKTGNPYFLNQLYRGLDPYGLAGAYISEALNTNQYTYEVAPVFTLCEMEVLKRALSIVGFKNGDGIFSPGGSISNMYAVALSKFKKFPEVKKKGLSHLPPLVIFTSQDAHYSILKSANWLGIGTDNVIAVETDEGGRMIPGKLREHIETVISEGRVPLMVNATVGTTVLGAFDPVKEIADICDKFGIWLHIDACWGGSFMFSATYSRLLDGIDRAKSIAWNPHKMLGAPLQCAMFLVNEKGLLHECNSANAAYLFQKDKMYDTSFDTGDKSIQCGRKVDGFKFWLMWKARGDSGFSELVDQAMHTARYFAGRLRSYPGFKLVLHDFQCTNICFWYIPERLRNPPSETEEWWDEIDKVAPKLKAKLVHSGSMMISYQPLPQKNMKNFFRVAVTCQPPPTIEQMDDVIEEIEKYGRDM